MKEHKSWETKHKNFQNYIRKYDEYYTRYEHVKDLFDRYIPHDELKDKVIYCPCDSDKSNFVIYLKEHKDDLGYKELIYTSDDYNTHLDLFEKCDIIITNPPFSKLIREFIPILNKVNKKFFILGSLISLCCYYSNFTDKDNIKYVRPDTYFNFIIPEDCNSSNSPVYIYISNLNIKNYHKEPTFDKLEKNMVHVIRTTDNKIYKHYSRINNIPLDEYDEIFVPSTVLLEHNRKYFNIIKINYIMDNRVKDGERYLFEDGKNRFYRMLVKRINKNT